jgi:Xaa-Pro aminopeptidase
MVRHQRDPCKAGWMAAPTPATEPLDHRFARRLRLAKVRTAMVEAGVDALLLSLGADLPWMTGYTAMPLERLTMLVLPADGDATLVIPKLEAPRVDHDPELFALRPWTELESPTSIVADLVGTRAKLAISDRCWATFLVDLQTLLPSASWAKASRVTSPLRMRKDAAEVHALVAASAAIDRVALQLHAGEIPLVGRTEADVSADLSARIIAEGHDHVNFAIVAAGENAASPHHHPASRVILAGEVVLCDFGGTMDGYCSDITRCVHTGEPTAEFSDLYDVLMASNAAGVAAGTVGTPCQDVDRAARRVIDDAGFGEFFIHRTGHGIGMEEHEDPYIVEGNTLPLAHGHAYSVEPGIYVPARWGARLEDIVIATDDGPMSLNHADHRLVVVDV